MMLFVLFYLNFINFENSDDRILTGLVSVEVTKLPLCLIQVVFIEVREKVPGCYTNN